MMISAIQEHRSIRKYKSEPIAPHILNSILEAGTRASTTGNMQVYSMVVSTESEIKNRLWEAHFKQNMVLQAPVHITFCADFNRFTKWCNQRDAVPGYANFLSFITASTDALLASQNVALEAEAQGLGICYLGTAVYNADKLIEILNLPTLVVPVAAMVIGFPEETPGLTDRLPLRAVVHQEVYKDYLPEDIDDLYKEKESMEFYKKLLEVNETTTLAQVFTQKRYTLKDNLFFSEKYLEVLKKQKFLNIG